MDVKLLPLVKALPSVLAVEPVRSVKPDCFSQDNADWGLRRISGKKRSASSFNYKNHGMGVTIYVVDTGVNLKHTEFEGRAKFGTNVYKSFVPSRDISDHGTAVASLAAGINTGIAKGADVVSVRIVDEGGESDDDDIAKAFTWIIQDHFKRAGAVNEGLALNELCNKKSSHVKPKSVVNLSMTMDGNSFLVKFASERLTDCGIIVVVSAGNEKDDACNHSPANLPNVVTVASTNQKDQLWQDSNYGPCVSVLAPGFDLKTASSAGVDRYRRRSGTSMSAPLVSGKAAIFLSSTEEQRNVPDFLSWLRLSSTSGVVEFPDYARQTPNILLHSGCYATPDEDCAALTLENFVLLIK